MDEVWTELSQHCFYQAENKELSPISSIPPSPLHYRLEPSSLVNLLYLCSFAHSTGTQVC